MANAYTWQFVKFDVYPTLNGLTNVVRSVHWKLTGNNGAGKIATAYGEQHIPAPAPESFTPFANLTSVQVQGWVEAQMGSELTGIRASLDNMIAQQITPTIVTMAPPW